MYTCKFTCTVLHSLNCIVCSRYVLLQSDIVIPEDNDANNAYWYAITVFTGARFSSGTSSKVGIAIEGDNGESGSHLLSSNSRKLFQTAGVDTILVSSPQHFGTLSSILYERHLQNLDHLIKDLYQ